MKNIFVPELPVFEENTPVVWVVNNGETSCTRNCTFLKNGDKFEDQALVEYSRDCGEKKQVWVARKNLRADESRA